MSTKRKIPFGLRDGRLFQPDEVSRGLACNCVCPGCGSRLVAHHGEKKVKHFVHYATACANGFESAIHSAAKQVLLESKCILVPSIQASEFLRDRKLNVEIDETQTIAQRYIPIENVEVEKDLGSVVPDLVVSGLGKTLFVEIAYTHFVDELKKGKLRELGIATLEIDLSSLSEVPSMNELARLVVEEPSNRMWVFNPKQEELNRRISAQAKQRLAEAIAKEELKQQEYRKRIEQYRNMSDEQKLIIELGTLGIKRNQLPDFLGVFVKGGNSFSASNLVWQTAVFSHFIFQTEFEYINVDMICNWAYQLFKVKRTSQNPKIHTEKIAVWHFLRHLEKIGFLAYLGNQEFCVVNYKLLIDSPNINWKQIPQSDLDGDLPF
jgi:hypothetical protein